MKLQNGFHLGAASSVQNLHKAFLHRTHYTKASIHRYERRKIREILRHANSGLNEDLDAAPF
jgi:hypothetical protein